jgi:hypothetical protein
VGRSELGDDESEGLVIWEKKIESKIEDLLTDMVAWIDFPTFLQESCNPFGSLMELGTCEGLGHRSLGVEQRVQHVIG